VHWVEVDGYALPKRIGGHPALDFCNTWAGWTGPHRWSPGGPPDPKREWLPDYDRFAVWAGFVGLVDPSGVDRIRAQARTSPGPAGAVVGRAHRLRDQVYRMLTDGSDTEAFVAFAAAAQTAVRATVLESGPDGTLRRTLPATVGVALPLLAAVRAVEDLLGDPHRAPVRACPGDDCGWLFLDPRGRRRWCDMGSCGNRAKARSFAVRHRTP
jgi:predicted RNA-binding Zn ribbon-like protein